MFEELVGLIHKIKDDSIGEWIVDKENDGTPEHPIQMPFVVYSRVVRQFERVVYNFEEEHPEFELNRYGSILERYDIKWETQSMSTVDVSKMDGQGVMALIMAAVRAERFCDGALKEFFENGSIEKWLCRLKEIEESGEFFVSKPMSNIELINGSCTDQDVDVVLTLQRLKHVGFLYIFTSKYTRKYMRLMSFYKTFTTKDTIASINDSIRLVSKPFIYFSV